MSGESSAFWLGLEFASVGHLASFCVLLRLAEEFPGSLLEWSLVKDCLIQPHPAANYLHWHWYRNTSIFRPNPISLTASKNDHEGYKHKQT